MKKLPYPVIFNELFFNESHPLTEIDDMYYSWFYFRTTPRGKTKFGITHLPWERLRMQQQGTDEEIQFDHLWLARASCKEIISLVENSLKKIYRNQCLHNTTKRAGHTEWYESININHFNKTLKKYQTECSFEIVKIKLKEPYTATNSSQCPLKLPYNSPGRGKEYIQKHLQDYWDHL